MEILLVWIVLVVVTGVVAHNKGRSVLGWVLLAILVAPIVLLIVLALPSLKTAPVAVTIADDGDLKKTCPRCAETVKYRAAVCRFCGHEFEPQKPVFRDHAPPGRP